MAQNADSRSPYGERGLKLRRVVRVVFVRCRSPYGERGLKSVINEMTQQTNRRSPYGERGLKLYRLRADIILKVALLTESVD